MKYSYLCVVLLFIGGAFYMMNSYEPLRCDDLIYQFFWLNERSQELLEPIDINNRIDNVFEAFLSQVNHYYVMNGRFVLHFLVSCFCGFWGRPLFSILNAIVYILFLVGCIKMLNIDNEIKSTIAIALIWFGLPIQYILWYSVAFAINYLWVSAAFLFFFILFDRCKQFDKKDSIAKLAGLFFIGLIMGSLHEGYSIPLSVATFVLFVFNKNTLNKKLLVLTFGLWLGTSFVVFAPGTIRRGVDVSSSVNVEDFLLMKLDVLRYSKRLYLFLVLFAGIFVFDRDRFVGFFKKKQLAVYFIIANFCFAMFVPHYSQRIVFPLELLSLLLSLDIIFNSSFIEKYKVHICSFLILLLLVHVPLTVYYAKIIAYEYTEMMNTYLASPDGETHYKNIVVPKYVSSYILRLDDGVEREYISFIYKKEMHIEK